MTTYEHEIEIETPIDYTFEWGLDAANWRRSMPAISAIELLEETDDGDRYRWTFKVLGRSMTGESVFTIVDPIAHTVSVMEGPDMTGEMHYYYTETDDGTTVRFVAELADAKSVFERALRPVFTRYMNRQFRSHLRTMKDLVEAEYPATVEDRAGDKAVIGVQ